MRTQIKTSPILLSFLIIACFHLSLIAENIGGNKVPVLAILPFENKQSEKTTWLGQGITDSLISKFSGSDQVKLIERESLELLLKTSQSKKLSDKIELIGANYLLLGSYSSIKDNIQIHLRIVNSKTARIVGDSVISVNGKLSDLLSLQTELAREISSRCQLEIGDIRLRYNHGATMNSYTAFNQGKVAYQNDQLQEALKLFLKAQQLNHGLYFAEAHSWEGKTRIQLSKIQNKAEAKKQIQREHIKKFEADAAEASHAFYDLGQAYQAAGQYKKAIHAYDQFLKWCNDHARHFLWRSHHAVAPLNTEIANGYFEHDKRQYDQNNCWCCRTFAFRNWTSVGDETFYLKRNPSTRQIFLTKCQSQNGQLIWEQPTIAKFPGRRNVLKVSPTKVYLLHHNQFFCFERKSGKRLNQFKLFDPISDAEFSIPPMLVVNENEQLLAVMGYYLNDVNDQYANHLIVYDLKTQKKLWSQYKQSSFRHASLQTWKNQLIAIRNGQLENLDWLTGFTIHKQESKKKHVPVNLWLGLDHILVRMSQNSRTAKGDRFFNWNPLNNEMSERKDPILFTYIYNQKFKDKSDLTIPIVDKDTGFYRLIPAQLILPYTAFKGMDKDDLQGSGDKDLADTIHHAWVVLQNDQLWIWNRKKMLYKLNVNDGRLQWKHYIPYSGGGLDAHQNLVFVRTRSQFRCFNAKTEHLSYRSLDAMLHKAHCFKALKQEGQEMKTLHQIINHDAKFEKAHFHLAETYARQKNIHKASFHYDHVTQFGLPSSLRYQQALAWMKQYTGLKKTIRLDAFHGLEVSQQGVYTHSEKGLVHHHIKESEDKLIHPQAEFWNISDKLILHSQLNQSQHKLYLNDQLHKVINLPPLKRIDCFATGIKANEKIDAYDRGLPLRLHQHLILHSQGHQFYIYDWKQKKRIFQMKAPHDSRVDFNQDRLILFHRKREKNDTKQEDLSFAHLATCYNLNPSLGEVGKVLWQTTLKKTSSSHLKHCFIMNKEVVFVTSQYRLSKTKKRNVVSIASIHRLDIKTGSIISYSVLKDFGIEFAKKVNGKILIELYRMNNPRRTIWYEEGMDAEDIFKRNTLVKHGTIINDIHSSNTFLIGAGARIDMHSRSHQIQIVNAKNGKELWNRKAFAASIPRHFRSNQQYLAFYSQGVVYVFDTFKFVQFFQGNQPFLAASEITIP